jgi:DNA-binding NtrC family response regulator
MFGSRQGQHRPEVDTTSNAPLAASSGAETILLVEDEPAVRTLFAAALTRAGYQVIEARNGEEGVAAFDRAAGRVSLLLTDLNMPLLGGSDLAKELLGRQPDLKLLFVSGYTTAPPLGGHAAFLAKPFAREDLLRTVRAVLDGRARHS